MTGAAEDGARIVNAITTLYPEGEWGRPEVEVRHGYTVLGVPGHRTGVVEEVEVRVRLRRYIDQVPQAPVVRAELTEEAHALLLTFPDNVFGRLLPPSDARTCLTDLGLLTLDVEAGLLVLTEKGKIARDTGKVPP